MKFKIAFLVLIIFLDVASPFSCISRRNYNPSIYYEFVNEVDGEIKNITDDTVTLDSKEYTIEEISKEGYIINQIQLLTNTEDSREFIDIELPYELKETDFMGYYQGRRNVVVIRVFVTANNQ